MKSVVEEQMQILMRGTQFGDEHLRRVMEQELRERLMEGRVNPGVDPTKYRAMYEIGAINKPLRVYLGVDPTAPDLHLGHTVPMRKLAQFQALGHHVIFLIGSFTALIGDPSDKDKARPQNTPEQIAENVRTYTEQAWKILDPERTEIRYNSEWLSELDFRDIIGLASQFTVSQFLQRDNFAQRFSHNDPIFLHEFFYALMQGYDAVALHNDVQIGGTDQTFNILAGRKLQEHFGQRPQILLTFPMLPGTDGVIKMSKSLGNAIGITEPPEDMYGKLMSIPDSAMPIYFDLLSPMHPSEIEAIFSELEAGERHPRDVKMLLARQITEVFHGPEAAERAEEHFKTVFQQRELPEELPIHRLTEPVSLVDLIASLNLASSKSEARRLIQQGGVTLDGEKVGEIDRLVAPSETPVVLRVGKRHFVELVS